MTETLCEMISIETYLGSCWYFEIENVAMHRGRKDRRNVVSESLGRRTLFWLRSLK